MARDGNDTEKEYAKVYTVRLTEKEIVMLTRGITAFYNVMTREKVMISIDQTIHINDALHKFKLALEGKAPLVLIRE